VRRVLVDTGPLVAIFSPEDEHHDICIKTLPDLPGPLFSCWPVVTEAAWLFRGADQRVEEFLESVSGGLLELLPISSLEARSIAKVMRRFSDLPAQLADATLVYLAEREDIDTIFTLNRRDFSVYRIGGKRPFNIIPKSE
jgi:predicted nucleic acid-binding protein